MGPIQNRHIQVMVELRIYIYLFFDSGRTDVNVSTEELKCLVCFCCDIIYMAIPFKVGLYCDTQLFCFICMFELVSMYGVCVYYWCFFSFDGEYITFVRVEGHFPFLFPYTKFI
jgi:hypothetical protein